ncbi:hypothetical protein LCGC14_0730230 [marine sediment metagenome]|uniref:PD-(D/E)XK endonuclease-like domain-containing protein n=1 Tax=marine sediment metagenome TaxID=412755 RepID=A0A0F9TH27_9ZZZZ
MVSLTSLLKQISDKSKLSKLFPKPQFSILSHPLVNPYPNWVNSLKGWGEFGTFSDYIIRKILLNLFPTKVMNTRIIAEDGWETLIATITSNDNPFLTTVLPDVAKKRLLTFSEETEVAIVNFYDSQTHWKKSIYEIYKMSCLDRIVRNDKLDMPRFSKKEVEECIPFFSHLEGWLKFKFTSSETIYPNPILGHESTLAADADLFIDSTLYEIKTVKRPLWYIENEYYQLFGYVSLLEYLKENVSSMERSVVKWEEIDTIGYIFPLHMQEVTMDISSWDKSHRLKYLSELIHYSHLI